MDSKRQHDFMTLYDPVHARLSNYCRSMANNRMDAEDLMNDTILAAFQQFDQVQEPDKFAGYLFSIASNLYKKQLRRKKFRGDYSEKEALQLEELGCDPETKAELSMIMHKIDQLPALQREALILFHISDLPMEDIRNIQGGSLSAVKQRIKRGRERLMQMLTERQSALFTLIL